MFVLTLRLADHVRHYSICAAGTEGWEIRFEEDSKLQRLDHCRDWHRVERVRAMFAREAEALQARGWQVVAGQSMKRYPSPTTVSI